jgi:hypothetical protein
VKELTLARTIAIVEPNLEEVVRRIVETGGMPS